MLLPESDRNPTRIQPSASPAFLAIRCSIRRAWLREEHGGSESTPLQEG